VIVPSQADLCSFTYLDEHGGIERTDLAWVIAGEPIRKTNPGSIPPAFARMWRSGSAKKKIEASTRSFGECNVQSKSK
jgi:hypothetical protein